MIGTQVITESGRVRLIGVPRLLLLRLNKHVIEFVERMKFCAELPEALPSSNVIQFRDVLVDMLADEVIAKLKGRAS